MTASGDKLLGGPQAGLILGALQCRPRGPAAPAPARPRRPGRQAHPRRVRGDATIARDTDLPGACTPTPPCCGRGRRRSPCASGASRAERRRCRRRGSARPDAGGLGGGDARGVRPGAASGRAVRGRPDRTGPLPARPALRAGRARRRAGSARSRRLPAGARDRDRGARRSRQVDAGPGADRHGARPLGRGAAAWHDDRPRVRVDAAALR